MAKHNNANHLPGPTPLFNHYSYSEAFRQPVNSYAMIIQLCGLSGAGKTTIANSVKKKALSYGTPLEIIDGDIYREFLCKDLGFSKADRCENIRRLGFVASRLSGHGIVCIISAINPYREAREELTQAYPNVKTVFVDCPVTELINRDTKGLYKRALLPEGHPEKLLNLTGVNDPFEIPDTPDLHLRTNEMSISACTGELYQFIQSFLPTQKHKNYKTAGALI